MERRRRRPGVDPPAPALRAAGRAGAPGRHRRPTPSCTATPTSASSTGHPPRGAGRRGGPPRPRGAGPHRPRRLLRRGPLRRGGPGRRPADGVRRRAHARRARPSGGIASTRRRRCPDRHGHAADRQAPDPAATTCWCSPTAPTATPAWPAPLSLGHLAGEKGAPQFTLDDVAGGHRRPLAGRSPAAARAPSRRRCSSDGPAAAAPRAATSWSTPSGATTCSSSCGTTATRSTRARNDALAELAAATAVECVATNNAHYATPAQRRLATAIAAVRARRSLDELDPWLPAAAGAHLRSGAEQARRFAPLPGRGRAGRRARPGGGVRPAARRPVAAAVPVPDGLGRDGVPAPPHRGGRAAGATARVPGRTTTTWRQGVAPRSTTSWRSSSSSGSPATSSWSGTSSSSADAATSSARAAGQRRQLGGLLRPRHHQRRRRVARPAVRALPVARARRAARHRHRHRVATGARRSSSTSTTSTAATTPPRWPTSSPTAPSRRSATWPRRSATRPASRTPGPSRSTRGAPSPPPRDHAGPRHPRAGARAGRRARARSRATSASTPAAW